MCIRCSMRTHPLMGTRPIVHSSFQGHSSDCPTTQAHSFLSSHFSWAVNLHESKLLWLTRLFRAALVWYSILAPQCTLYPHCTNFSTDALLHLLFLPFSFPPFSGASAHPPLFMFYAFCMPSTMSSTLHLPRVSWAAFHFHCHILFMSYIYSLDFTHSALLI